MTIVQNVEIPEDQFTEDELKSVAKPKKRNTVVIDDEAISLNGPVKTPATSLYQVPQEIEFGSAEFLEELGKTEGSLASLADHLIASKSHIGHLKFMDVRYYWKKKGGTSKGGKTLGKCIKPTGLLRQALDTDFVVWLAADNCQGMSKHEVEAVLFHELCHAGRDDEGNRVILGHDVEDFVAVIREYGLVSPELRAVGKAIKQLGFDL